MINSPESHRPRSPYRRAAKDFYERHRPQDRQAGKRGPFPRNWPVFANYLAIAHPIYLDIKALDAAERDGSGRVSDTDPVFQLPGLLRFSSLTMALTATRPWGEVEPGALGVTDEDRERMILPLALALAETWRGHDPKHRARVRKLATECGWTPDEVKVDAVYRAILLVQADRETSQQVKVGRSWETGEDGTKRSRNPTNLLHVDYLQWFRAQVVRVAGEILADQAAIHVDNIELHDPLDSSSPLAFALDSSCLDALEAMERREGEADPLAPLRELASDGQKSMLDALIAAYALVDDQADARALAAQQLGWAPSTLRVQWGRLMEKGRAAGVVP